MTAPYDVFTAAKLGPITLRNRVIKAATFEASTPNALVTDDLITYHRLPAAGGVGMTTVAYLAVSPGGRTEGNQIYWRPEAIPGLRRLTESNHAEGAAISAQIASSESTLLIGPWKRLARSQAMAPMLRLGAGRASTGVVFKVSLLTYRSTSAMRALNQFMNIETSRLSVR